MTVQVVHLKPSDTLLLYGNIPAVHDEAMWEAFQQQLEKLRGRLGVKEVAVLDGITGVTVLRVREPEERTQSPVAPRSTGVAEEMPGVAEYVQALQQSMDRRA